MIQTKVQTKNETKKYILLSQPFVIRLTFPYFALNSKKKSSNINKSEPSYNLENYTK